MAHLVCVYFWRTVALKRFIKLYRTFLIFCSVNFWFESSLVTMFLTGTCLYLARQPRLTVRHRFVVVVAPRLPSAVFYGTTQT